MYAQGLKSVLQDEGQKFDQAGLAYTYYNQRNKNIISLEYLLPVSPIRIIGRFA